MFSHLAGKVAFVNYIPLLTQATADDGEPTPGYLLGEIKNITFQSQSSCQQLVEYVIHRLNKSSTSVKIKVLKIIIYLLNNGHVSFRQLLRQYDGPIKSAVLHYGPPDPLLGNAPYKEVQKLAQEILDFIFSPEIMKQEEAEANGLVSLEAPAAFMGGMGATARSGGKYDGFGNTPRDREGTVTDKMLDYLGRLIHPSEEQTSEVIRAALHSSPGDYQPVSVVTSVIEPAVSSESAASKLPFEKSHTPGRAGGGWESDEDADETEHSCSTEHAMLNTSSINPSPEIINLRDQFEDSLEQHNFQTFEPIIFHYCDSPGIPTIDELDETSALCSPDNYVNVLQTLTNICSKSLHDLNEGRLMRILLLWEWICYSSFITGKTLHEGLSTILNEILARDKVPQVIRSKAKKINLILSKQQTVLSLETTN